jgi:hypothetical protein
MNVHVITLAPAASSSSTDRASQVKSFTTRLVSQLQLSHIASHSYDNHTIYSKLSAEQRGTEALPNNC